MRTRSPKKKQGTRNMANTREVTKERGLTPHLLKTRASLAAQLVKNPPAMRETWVQFLGWEDPLEKGKATHSSILAWRIPWTVLSMGSEQLSLLKTSLTPSRISIEDGTLHQQRTNLLAGRNIKKSIHSFIHSIALGKCLLITSHRAS